MPKQLLKHNRFRYSISNSTLKYVVLNLILAALAAEAGSLMAPRWTGSDTPLAQVRAAAERKVAGETTAGSQHPANVNRPDSSEGDALSEDEIKSSLSNLGKMQSEATYDRMMKLLNALAALDPNAAIEYALLQLREPFQEKALSSILDVWSKNDPHAAWNWVKTQRADDSLLTGTVLKKVGETQPDMAWKFATELAQTMPNQAAGLYVSAMIGMAAVGNYEDAVRLLNSAVLPQKALDSAYGLTGFLASEWAEYEPDQAAAWVLTLPDGSNDRRQAVIALGQAWANINPQAAAKFASQLPPSSERISMLTSAINAWYGSNPTQVGAWISSIPKGPDYDQFAAAIAISPRIVNSSPQTSIAWAMDISDNELKMQSLAAVCGQWIIHDEVSAGNYLAQLPPAMQENLLQRLNLPNFKQP
jgi:hypothetical protein